MPTLGLKQGCVATKALVGLSSRIEHATASVQKNHTGSRLLGLIAVGSPPPQVQRLAGAVADRNRQGLGCGCLRCLDLRRVRLGCFSRVCGNLL